MIDSPGAAQSCPKCGAAVPADAAEGLCPRCLRGEPVQPTGPAMPWQPPSAAELAKLLPEYDVHMLIGRGGMGAVYKGTQKSLERPVAIKILSATLDQGFAERFKNEARALAKLKHPKIVGIYDFGTAANGLLYIVMEYIDGTDVSRMIGKQGRLHTDHAMAIAAHVCEALAYAHERGIIHRDIKPANIMVTSDGNVKVADFGLAKMTHAPESGLTRSGVAVGTLHYMAPEAVMLSDAVDHRADIYSVGVMLYQMLTGKIPQGMFKMPSLQFKGLDPRFDGIVAKALREDRESRYQSIREMRIDLDEILTQPVLKVEKVVETRAAPAEPVQVPPDRQPAVAVKAAEYEYLEHSRRRQPSEQLSLGIAVVLILLGVLYLVWPRTNSGGQEEADEMVEQVVGKPAAEPAVPPGVAGKATTKPAATTVPAAPSQRVDGLAADGEWSDVLARLDPTRAELKGKWEMTADGLKLGEAADAGIIGMPTEPLARFEARIRFTTSQHERFDILLPSPSSHFGFSFFPEQKTIGIAGSRADTLPMDHLSTTTGGVHEIRIGVTPFSLSVVMDSVVVYERAPVDWVRHAASGGMLGLQLHQGRGVFHSFDIRIPSPGALPPADVPEIASLVSEHQKTRGRQLTSLTNELQRALIAAESDGVKSGGGPPLVALRQIMKQIDWRSTEIDELRGTLIVAPLTSLPALMQDAPEAVKRLLAAYDRDVTKTEMELAVAFDDTLKALQAGLAKAGNDEKAVEVERYRQAVTPHGIALPLLASALLEATPDAPFVNSLGMKFLPLPDSAVLMGVHEVRWKDYSTYAEDTQAADNSWKDQELHGIKPAGRLEDHPVANVTWNQAQKFCEWLSKKEGRTYRLPTDLEWSTAAGLNDRDHRAPDETPESAPKHPGLFPWGRGWPPPPGAGNFKDQSSSGITLDASHLPVAGYDDGFPTTAPVMSFPPNRLGLYDLSGNLWEWCLDWWGAGKQYRLLRGGSFTTSQAGDLLSDRRYRFGSNTSSPGFGFRCVLDLRSPDLIPVP